MSISTGDRYFFVHLQKTGGTTLVHRLPRQFRPAEIYPNDSDGDVVQSTISVDHLVDRWRVRGPEIRIVTGHFPLCTREVLGTNFKTLTVLRDPVERTLSYLRFHREMTPVDREKPLEAIYEDSLRFHGLIQNHMVKMLSLTTSEMTEGALTRIEFTRERLEQAFVSLLDIDIVGFQERFGNFWDDLSRQFGWDLGKPSRSNVTRPVDVSKTFRARIAHDNALDVELYNRALALQAQSAEQGRGVSIA